mmetsp:Transcript_47636/g.120078  ORF Transcript_47636/g.120078 Transcript_47636/m.120078 type:complete len:386 (-) Transcript_47636:74-1231(-)
MPGEGFHALLSLHDQRLHFCKGLRGDLPTLHLCHKLGFQAVKNAPVVDITQLLAVSPNNGGTALDPILVLAETNGWTLGLGSHKGGNVLFQQFIFLVFLAVWRDGCLHIFCSLVHIGPCNFQRLVDLLSQFQHFCLRLWCPLDEGFHQRLCRDHKLLSSRACSHRVCDLTFQSNLLLLHLFLPNGLGSLGCRLPSLNDSKLRRTLDVDDFVGQLGPVSLHLRRKFSLLDLRTTGHALLGEVLDLCGKLVSQLQHSRGVLGLQLDCLILQASCTLQVRELGLNRLHNRLNFFHQLLGPLRHLCLLFALLLDVRCMGTSQLQSLLELLLHLFVEATHCLKLLLHGIEDLRLEKVDVIWSGKAQLLDGSPDDVRGAELRGVSHCNRHL